MIDGAGVNRLTARLLLELYWGLRAYGGAPRVLVLGSAVRLSPGAKRVVARLHLMVSPASGHDLRPDRVILRGDRVSA